MTTDTIPEDIAARIEQAIEAQRQKDEQEERERAKALAEEQRSNYEAWAAFAANAAAQLDPDVAPYLVVTQRNNRPRGNEYVNVYVPGLAPVQVVFAEQYNKQAGHSVFVLTRYIVPGIDVKIDYDDGQACEVVWNFHNGHECASLDEALVMARQRQAEYDERLADLERANQARAERARERVLQQAGRERRQAEAEAQGEQERETEAVRQLREEQLLLDTLKDDPVAVSLLKLFSAVQVEREHWQERIDGMEEAASWTEARHDEHLGRVREEARTYERQAREADERARDLDSELDETKRKARQAGVRL
jgi:hypothetical protein